MPLLSFVTNLGMGGSTVAVAASETIGVTSTVTDTLGVTCAMTDTAGINSTITDTAGIDSEIGGETIGVESNIQ